MPTAATPARIMTPEEGDHSLPQSVRTQNAIWRSYLEEIRRRREPWNGPSAERFAYEGLRIGTLETSSLADLAGTLDRARTGPLDADRQDPQFFGTPSPQSVRDILSRDQSYMTLNSRELWAIWNVLEELKAPVAEALGQPWSVSSVRAWVTPRSETRDGPYGWHYDCFPRDVHKIMIYLSPIGPDIGGIDVALRDGSYVSLQGEAGLWLLFKNSLVYHRGTPPRVPGRERKAVEITLTPSTAFELRPTFRGNNVRHAADPARKAIFMPF